MKQPTEGEMVGWHHQLSGHELEPTPGDSRGQGAWCAAAHGVMEAHRIERLNNDQAL